MITKLTAMVLAVAMVSGVASAQTARTEEHVVSDVARTIDVYTHYTIFDNVDARLDDGVVTLSGKVTMPYKRTDIEKRVAAVSGVTAVHNEIEVLPASRFDDDLRYRVAHAIYGSSWFSDYANMVNPPIHVIVDRGHVTLTGVVNSDVDRMIAGSIAATTEGAFSVTNDLRVG